MRISSKKKSNLPNKFVLILLEDKLVCLDPNICQATVDILPADDCAALTSLEIYDTSSYHSETVNKIEFSKLEPNMAIGFFCSSLEDLNDLCEFVKKVTISSDRIIQY